MIFNVSWNLIRKSNISMNNQHLFYAQWQLEPQIFFNSPSYIQYRKEKSFANNQSCCSMNFCLVQKAQSWHWLLIVFLFGTEVGSACQKSSLSQITSRSYLSWRLELLAGHMYGIRRVIFPQTPAHVDSSFNFRLNKIFRQEYLQNFTFSTPPSSRSTFAAHGFSILSTIDSYYLNYRSVHCGFSISGFVPTELPVPPGPLSFPLCVLSLIACLSFSQSGFGGKGKIRGFLKSVWRGWSSTIESQTLLRTGRGKPEVWLFCSTVSSLCTLNTEQPGYTFYFLHPVVNGHKPSQKVWDVSLSSQVQGEQPLNN